MESSQKKSRLSHGDGLFAGAPCREASSGTLFACFSSILQGDHAGVEFACASHSQLLRDFGLLDFESTVSGAGPVLARDVFQGLVIDDYFSISVEPKLTGKVARSSKAFDRAQQAYSRFHLGGSPEMTSRTPPKLK